MENAFSEILRGAKAGKTAVAAINILNYNTARAVLLAAGRAGRPVVLQPSTGTVRRYGVQEMFRMLNGLRQSTGVQAAIHLDHCTDQALAFACIDAGWDAVMVDYSSLPLGQNIENTRRVVKAAHRRGAAVEGEVGIVSGAEEEIVHDQEVLAEYDEVTEYLEKTGVDAIAPAIGTAHGVYKQRPKLNFTLVEKLGRQPVPIVVHGGTGLPAEDFQKLIALGAAKINLSTVLKNTYLGASRAALRNEAVAPLEFDLQVENAVSAAIEKFIRLFAGEAVAL